MRNIPFLFLLILLVSSIGGCKCHCKTKIVDTPLKIDSNVFWKNKLNINRIVVIDSIDYYVEKIHFDEEDQNIIVYKGPHHYEVKRDSIKIIK
jgi:hypothetical protein